MDWYGDPETSDLPRYVSRVLLTILEQESEQHDAQRLRLDFLPITWHDGLEILGLGETTQVSQSIVTVERSFAFKRRPQQTNRTDAELIEALCVEATILRHEPIRRDHYIVDVLGCLWESDASGKDTWPTLVFPKADYGSMQTFLGSDEGRKTTLDTKWRLCCDIIGAVQKLHACNVVHGDLKPDNVLIFQDPALGLIGKVADFGFSCFGENDKHRVQPPKSEPWVGPEWHHRGFSIKDAKLLDVFSLGMICLWTMMEHVSHSSTALDAGTMANESSMSALGEQSSIDTLQHWKSQRRLPQLAAEIVESLQELSENEKSGLLVLLNRTLQHNASEREVNLIQLADRVRSPRYANLIDLESCSSIQRLNHHQFRLVAALPQLSLVSYQVRLKILRALESALCSWERDENCFCCHSCSKNAAFQLALSLHLGLAGSQDDVMSTEWLRRSSRSLQDLEKEVKVLQEGSFILQYTGEFQRLKDSGLIHLTDFTEQLAHLSASISFEKMCRQEIVAFSSVLGESHFITIVLKQSLASVYKTKSKYVEALDLEQECLKSLQRSKDSDERSTFKAMLQLSSTYCHLGRYQEALDLQAKSHCLAKAIFGNDHPSTFSTAAALACTYYEMGEWARAEPEFVYLSGVSEHLFGVRHPETLSLKANTAMALKRLGKLDDSLALEELITKECLETLGPESTMTWRIVSNLAQSYIAQNQFELAEKALKSLTLPQEEAWSKISVDKLRILNILSLVYSSQQRFDAARSILDRNLQVQRRILGSDHIDTIRTSLMRARLGLDEGDREHSISMIEAIFEVYTGSGDNNEGSVDLDMELVQLCKWLTLWDRAATLQRQMLSRTCRTFGPKHPKALEAKASLCEILANQGKFQEVDTLEHSITTDRLNTITDKDMAVAILAPLAKVGSIYIDQDNELQRAQRLLEKVCLGASALLGQTDLITLNALGNLASAYALSGMPEEAYNTYLKVIKIKVKAFGADDPSTLTTLANFTHFCRCVGIEPIPMAPASSSEE